MTKKSNTPPKPPKGIPILLDLKGSGVAKAGHFESHGSTRVWIDPVPYTAEAEWLVLYNLQNPDNLPPADPEVQEVIEGLIETARVTHITKSDKSGGAGE